MGLLDLVPLINMSNTLSLGSRRGHLLSLSKSDWDLDTVQRHIMYKDVLKHNVLVDFLVKSYVSHNHIFFNKMARIFIKKKLASNWIQWSMSICTIDHTYILWPLIIINEQELLGTSFAWSFSWVITYKLSFLCELCDNGYMLRNLRFSNSQWEIYFFNLII